MHPSPLRLTQGILAGKKKKPPRTRERKATSHDRPCDETMILAQKTKRGRENLFYFLVLFRSRRRSAAVNQHQYICRLVKSYYVQPDLDTTNRAYVRCFPIMVPFP